MASANSFLVFSQLAFVLCFFVLRLFENLSFRDNASCSSGSDVSSLLISDSALESKLVSQFCEDENGALIYNRVTNGYNGYGNNGNNGNYATGGYGYQPVTGQHVLTGGTNTGTSTHSGRGRVETTQHGSKESSSAHVWNT